VIASANKRPAAWDGPAYRRGMSPLSAIEFLQREFPPRDMLLVPWLPTQGLGMIYGARGLGKTHVSLNIAYAVATGGEFLGWKAPQPRRVLFIDGEMPAGLLQERLAAIVATNPEPDTLEFLTILSADAEPDGLPDLSDPSGQAYYEPYFDEADVIIVDNLSTICRGVRENEADSWGASRTGPCR
jgi:putative DNA primase/helicase